jgi:lambda family phage portal protein
MSAHYRGASTSRLFYDWAAGILSSDSEVRGNLTILRARARQLARDNPYITAFLNDVADNVIGARGIILQPRVTNSAGEPVKRTNWSIQDAWNEWAMPENASIDGMDSWVDLQRQHIQAIARDGESIIRRRAGADNAFGFALQLLDPDLLDETYDRAPDADGVEIRMGVEVNADGKPLAYHLFTRHPSELYRRRTPEADRRVRVPADEIIHDFVRLRPGQTRGVTWLAPVLTSVKMLDGYEEAELVAARLQAAQMGAIVNKSPDAYIPPKPGEESQPVVLPAEPGSLFELRPGQEIQMFDPKHPSMAFEAFTKTVLRAISRGLGVAYHSLTGDLREANYSSLRAGLLPERDHWRGLQVWLSTRCHRRVFRWWIPAALASGMLQVDRRIPGELYPHAWKGRGWPWVDPLKDLQSSEMEIMLGLNSRQRLHGERGTNYEDVVDELAYEAQYAAGEGVDVAPERRVVPAEQGSTDEPADRPEARRLAVVNP